jgi:ubiquinone/menaquinone biosynthesis C-methylase UbiE
MHKFSHHNAERLENANRYKLLRPGTTLKKFGLRPGMTFIDIGAGTGFFSREAADIVGENGIVYALDMSPEMLEILKRNGVRKNMRVVLSDEYQLPVPDEIGNLTLLSSVLHENTDTKRMLAEAIRVTEKAGLVAIIEWKKQDEEIGPPKAERMDRQELLPALSDYDIVGQGDLNKSHYFVLIGRK